MKMRLEHARTEKIKLMDVFTLFLDQNCKSEWNTYMENYNEIETINGSVPVENK